MKEITSSRKRHSGPSFRPSSRNLAGISLRHPEQRDGSSHIYKKLACGGLFYCPKAIFPQNMLLNPPKSAKWQHNFQFIHNISLTKAAKHATKTHDFIFLVAQSHTQVPQTALEPLNLFTKFNTNFTFFRLLVAHFRKIAFICRPSPSKKVYS